VWPSIDAGARSIAQDAAIDGNMFVAIARSRRPKCQAANARRDEGANRMEKSCEAATRRERERREPGPARAHNRVALTRAARMEHRDRRARAG
jgi:hypothetical protein